MRYLWIALGIAVLHRLVVVGLAGLTFVVAMSAFNGGGVPALAAPLAFVTLILDFPLSVFRLLPVFLVHGPPSGTELMQLGMISFASPLWAQLASSLCIGTIVAIILYLRHKKKYGHLPPRYWKKGM